MGLRGHGSGAFRPGKGSAGWLAGSALGILCCGPAHATDLQPAPVTDEGAKLSEVVVVAQKRAESIQSIPASITAFKAQTLADASVLDLQGVTDLDTSLIIGEGTGQAVPFLRGIGNPVRNIGDEASTSIYVDGVYYSRIPAALFELNNIDRVEVLKGPQGTLFGRNSEGGLINIITRDPTQKPALEVGAGYGSFDTFRGSLYAAAPLGDKAAIDISALEVNQGEGWGRDRVTGGRNGYEDASAIRSKLVLRPTEGTEVKLSADYINTRSTDGLSSNAYRGTTQGLPTPNSPVAPLATIPFYDTENDVNNVADEKSWGVAAFIKQSIGFADLVSITAYRRATERLLQDGDDSPAPYSIARLTDHSNQVSQELQLVSRRGAPFDWIVGFYYLDQIGGYTPVAQFGTRFGPAVIDVFSKATDTSYAGFGQATFHLVPKLNLTLGARYTTDDVGGSGHTDTVLPTGVKPGAFTSADKTYDKATYKAVLDYSFDRSTTGYVSYSTGFKAGVFASLPFSPVPVEPESLTAYEVGEKTELFDHRLRINSAFFYYDISNLQVQAVVTAPSVSLLLVNAPRAHSTGFDLNGQAAITNKLSATFGFTVLDARYDTFPRAPSYAPILPYGNGPLTSINAAGNDLPRSPRFAFNVGVNYRLDSRIGLMVASANFAYNTGYYWDPDNRHRQSAVGLLDLNLSYQRHADDPWTLRLWIKNLADEHYYWGENETAGPSGTPGVVAPPRTFGFSVNYKL